MAKDFSFDIVSKIDLQEIVNAIDQAMREINQRYDFKDSNTIIELNKEQREITIHTIDEYKIKAAWEILNTKIAKRGQPLKAFIPEKPVTTGLNKIYMKIKIQNGIPQEKAKEIVKLIKEMKLKVQSTIHQDTIRVSGAKKDDLQSVIKRLKEIDFGIDMQFVNYR